MMQINVLAVSRDKVVADWVALYRLYWDVIELAHDAGVFRYRRAAPSRNAAASLSPPVSSTQPELSRERSIRQQEVEPLRLGRLTTVFARMEGECDFLPGSLLVLDPFVSSPAVVRRFVA
ncbi:hypothetical protein K438DRAFT_1995021 [Mycena galopus ATCC 62051]|nr:hypothetical protein K438DRAFT_1995021 [Mycena galopus ATCC 62051]